MTGALMEARGLTRRFGSVTALDGVDFDLKPGEIHCLFGENGAGKSTLASILAGVIAPDDGALAVGGGPRRYGSPADAIADGVGMVHQHFALVEAFTVLENLMVGLPGRGWRPDRAGLAGRARALAEDLGIALDPAARVSTLSVGERQWIEILKSLMEAGRILILDEPTAVLTPEESRRLFAMLDGLKRRGLGIVLVSHKLVEVMQSDRVTVLRRGRKVATLATADTDPGTLTRMMIGASPPPEGTQAPRAAGAVVVETRALTSAEGAGGVPARDVSLTIRAGEIVGVAGVAGNGQAALFDMLAGALAPASGEIVIDGARVSPVSPKEMMRRGVRCIPEDRFRQGLVGEMSISENLMLGRHRAAPFRRGPFVDYGAVDRVAATVIDAFRIATTGPQARAASLSGGNAQKVLLAREMAPGGRVLLANQPTRGLDVGVVATVHAALRAKRDEGAAVLLASEELDDLLALCDRILVMFRGRVMAAMSARDADVERIGALMAGRQPEAAA